MTVYVVERSGDGQAMAIHATERSAQADARRRGQGSMMFRYTVSKWQVVDWFPEQKGVTNESEHN